MLIFLEQLCRMMNSNLPKSNRSIDEEPSSGNAIEAHSGRAQVRQDQSQTIESYIELAVEEPPQASRGRDVLTAIAQAATYLAPTPFARIAAVVSRLLLISLTRIMNSNLPKSNRTIDLNEYDEEPSSGNEREATEAHQGRIQVREDQQAQTIEGYFELAVEEQAEANRGRDVWRAIAQAANYIAPNPLVRGAAAITQFFSNSAAGQVVHENPERRIFRLRAGVIWQNPSPGGILGLSLVSGSILAAIYLVRHR